MIRRESYVRERNGFTLVELLVVIAIIAILIGLLLPAIQKVRESANRAKCQNNLKQLGLAAISYCDANEGFPPPLVSGPNSNSATSASAFVVLLPYLEQQALYQQIYINQNFVGGPSSPFATPLSVLACPSDSGLPSPPVVQLPGTNNYYSVTSYRYNVSGLPVSDSNYQQDGVFVPATVLITDISDGTSNTILFGEFSNFDPNWPQYAPILAQNGSTNWPLSLTLSVWTINESAASNQPGFSGGSGYYPLNTLLSLPPPSGSGFPAMLALANALGVRASTYGSGHTGGANFVFCDGSGHFISNAIASTPGGLLSALSTRAGGETINASGF